MKKVILCLLLGISLVACQSKKSVDVTQFFQNVAKQSEKLDSIKFNIDTEVKMQDTAMALKASAVIEARFEPFLVYSEIKLTAANGNDTTSNDLKMYIDKNNTYVEYQNSWLATTTTQFDYTKDIIDSFRKNEVALFEKYKDSVKITESNNEFTVTLNSNKFEFEELLKIAGMDASQTTLIQKFKEESGKIEQISLTQIYDKNYEIKESKMVVDFSVQNGGNTQKISVAANLKVDPNKENIIKSIPEEVIKNAKRG